MQSHGGKRPGAGRPPSEDPLQVAQVRFRAETLEAIAQVAQSEGKTVSELVRSVAEACFNAETIEVLSHAAHTEKRSVGEIVRSIVDAWVARRTKS